jgi:hypothetical protein
VITEAVGDGLGVFDRARNQSYVLNATSALVFQHCDGQTTPQQLAGLLRQKFNLSDQQAEKLLGLTLAELAKANLLQSSVERPADPARRQLIITLARAGLALILLPVVAPVTVHAATGSVFPTLQCVVNNGDGTYTAYFGYINTSSSTVIIPFDPSHAKNMFTSNPKYRGQPDTFLPGTHDFVFSVVFDGNKITWMLKEDQAARQQVDADANSGCANPPPTTTPPPATTTFEPPTTTGNPFTTTSY